MTTTTSKVDARRRAREAKAKADASRLERDKKIEDATTNYYLASDKLEALHAQISAAEAEVDAHVLGLLELGEPVERVADLTGLSGGEIRTIRRRAKKTSAATPPAASEDPEGADD